MSCPLSILPASLAGDPTRDVGRAPARAVALTVDGRPVSVTEGDTILDACAALGVEVPTLCFAPNLPPAAVCRICVVELEGARTLVPSCSRRAEAGMVVRTDSERVRTARKLVLELLASSADLSAAPQIAGWMARYGADPARFGRCASAAGRPAKVDNPLFVRDYAKCILCYRCVAACGAGAQNSFAIAAAGRGFEARISTEFEAALPDSACVFCGNCVGVCPTGALPFLREYELRRDGGWDEGRQEQTTTVCPYCGVGCPITLHTQSGQVVKVTSPHRSTVTDGHLCIKGRFGWQFVGGQDGSPAGGRERPE